MSDWFQLGGMIVTAGAALGGAWIAAAVMAKSNEAGRKFDRATQREQAEWRRTDESIDRRISLYKTVSLLGTTIIAKNKDDTTSREGVIRLCELAAEIGMIDCSTEVRVAAEKVLSAATDLWTSESKGEMAGPLGRAIGEFELAARVELELEYARRQNRTA